MKDARSVLSIFGKGIVNGLGIGTGISIALATTTLFAAAAAIKLFSSGEVISATELNRNFAISAPEGAVIAFNLSACPEGWTPADGSDGTPDLRGRFVRGLNDFGTGSSGIDPDGLRALRSMQADAFQGHWHKIRSWSPGGGVYKYVLYYETSAQLAVSDLAYEDGISARGIIADDTNGNPRSSTETRPVNVGLIYCVRKN